MKSLFNKCIMSAVALSAPFAAQAQDARLPAILGDPAVAAKNPLPDFSYAGYGFGIAPIPDIETVVDVADYGAIPDDGQDDSAALKAALAAAAERGGPVRVQMHAGRYMLTEILWIETSGVVLSGMGMGQGGTELYMPRPLNQVDDGGALKELREYLVENDKREREKDINLDVLFSPYSWSGGFIWTRFPGGRHATYLERYDRPEVQVADITAGKQFTRELTVADAGRLKVGQVLQIHWHNRAGPDGPLIDELYGDTDLKIGSRNWDMPDRPLVRQATRIEAIDGNRVTIADPLLQAIGADLPAHFAQWDHISEVGLQDFAMIFPENPHFGHHNESGFNGIYFTGVQNGWIRNVRVANGDSGILTDDLANVTIRNIVTEGDHPAHYSVHMGNVHNVLVDRLSVFDPTRHSLSFNTQATRSVYRSAEVWTTPTLDQHAGANHQNLFDNVVVHMIPDETAKDGTPQYNLFSAGGAGYWLPRHGLYNTVWNLRIDVESGVEPGQPVSIVAPDGGPGARIVGVSANRPLRLDYDPEPYLEDIGEPIDAAPSLYSYQLGRRRGE